MKKKKNKKIDINSSNFYEEEGKHSTPMPCNDCPLVYIMRIANFEQFSDNFKDSSIYLNPLIED